jgi:hypothetical protein
MRVLNRAVEVLGDPQQRREYDRRRLMARARDALARAPAAISEARPYDANATGRKASPAPQRPSAATAGQNGSGGRRRSKRSLVALFLVSWAITLGILAVIAIRVATNSGDGQSPVVGEAPKPTISGAPTSSSATPTAAGASASPASSVSPFPYGSAIFESRGTAWLVGEQMIPGVWRGYRGGLCSWKRLSSPEVRDDTVIASGSTLTVEIKPSDAAFWSEECGWWTQVLDPPSDAPTDPFGPGTWLVGSEIAPGLWQNADSSHGCSWARLNSLDGGPETTVANGATSSSRIAVEISADDTAFHSWGCGSWIRIGD